MSATRPCPFCGLGDAVARRCAGYGSGRDGAVEFVELFWYECRACGSATSAKRSRDEAVSFWNGTGAPGPTWSPEPSAREPDE